MDSVPGQKPQTKNTYTAVFKKIIPNKTDFNYFDARCMARNIDNFANAQRKCEFAKTRSDVSSGADENQYKISKRLKNKKQTLINSSSESESVQQIKKFSMIETCTNDIEEDRSY